VQIPDGVLKTSTVRPSSLGGRKTEWPARPHLAGLQRGVIRPNGPREERRGSADMIGCQSRIDYHAPALVRSVKWAIRVPIACTGALVGLKWGALVQLCGCMIQGMNTNDDSRCPHAEPEDKGLPPSLQAGYRAHSAVVTGR
jgi:hypothetical protein